MEQPYELDASVSAFMYFNNNSIKFTWNIDSNPLTSKYFNPGVDAKWYDYLLGFTQSLSYYLHCH